MGKYSTQQLDRSVLLVVEDGMGVHEAQQAAGVSHSPAELHAWRFEWYCANLPEPGKGEWAPTEELVVYLRRLAEDTTGKVGWSYGRIAVALNIPESKVRKLYRLGTNEEDKGHRTGKGGRFAHTLGGRELYRDGLEATGTYVQVGEDAPPTGQQAERQRLMRHDIGELRAMAKEQGVRLPKNCTKVQAAMKLAAAIA